jgi:hypothetical protein
LFITRTLSRVTFLTSGSRGAAQTLIAVVVGCVVAAPAHAQHSALLLGMSANGTSTVLVEVHGDTVRVRAGSGIVVPRKSGFWRVGVDAPPPEYPDLRARAIAFHHIDTTLTDSARVAAVLAQEEARERAAAAEDSARLANPRADSAEREEANAYGEPLGHEPCFARQLWAAPLGTWPVLAPPDCEEGMVPAGDVFFRFVSSDYVSASLELTGEYSYGFARAAILGSLDSLARGFTAIYADLAGDGGPPRTPSTRRRERACDESWIRGILQMEPEDMPGERPDYRGTMIHRLAGRWGYASYYALTSHAGRGAESTCELGVRVPFKVSGWDSLTVPWKTIKRQMPSAFDAFASPAGDVVVVLTPQAIVVRRRAGVSLGRTLAAVPWSSILAPYTVTPTEPEGTVMSQWATGANAVRWARTLKPVLDRAVVPSEKVRTP